MMTQKLLISGLALSIIAVIGFGLIDAARVPEDSNIIVLAATPQPTSTTIATEILPEVTEVIFEPTLQPIPETTQEPVIQAQTTMGDPWQMDGTISMMDDVGLTLSTTEGDFYVELGPSTYWQTQGVTLAIGDPITVDGFYNGQQVHARIVTSNNAQLTIRTESGQPMWSGGASNGNSDAGSAQVQGEPIDWVTYTGTIGSVSNGNVTLNVDDGTVLPLQMGQPQFWQGQGVTLNVNDPVEVLGFWSGTQFMVGDVRKTETGETIMIRDPNGRQLWGGPGRTGSGSNGSGGNGSQGNQGNGNQSNGNQGNGNQGNGNQGNGNQGNGNQRNGGN